MSNKEVLDIKEQALEKIKSLQKLEPDFVLSWLSGLTDLEQKIVSVMYINNKALTIKDVINTLIKHTFTHLTYRNYPPSIKNLRELNFPFISYYFADENIKRKIISMCSKEENLPSNIDNKSLTDSITLLKKEIKFPSFRRIDKSIQDLMSMGIVQAREEKSENKKIKGLYYLNPIIRTQINKLKKE